MNKVTTNGVTYTDKNIQDIRLFTSNSIIMDELPIDTFDVTVDVARIVPTVFKPSDYNGFVINDGGPKILAVDPFVTKYLDDPTAYAYGQKVACHHDGQLMGVYHLSDVSRVGRTAYTLSCVSAMGLLDTAKKHYGGVYNGVTVETLAAEIIGDIIPYTVDERIKNITLYGWLPIASPRENLHQLLLAVGGAVLKSTDGNVYLSAIDASIPTAIPDDRIACGGKVEYGAAVNHVAVTEHAFAQLPTEATTLFEGEIADIAITTPKGETKNGALITFSGPMFGLAAEGCTILESGVNYAVLSPSTGGKLTGKPYTHTTRVVTRNKPQSRSLVSQSDNSVSITDATLVSVANSEAVADRMMTYYGSLKTVTQDIYVDGERPGDPVSFNDPYGEEATGILKSLDMTLGSVLRASGVAVLDYNPPPPGNYYTHSAVLTGSGTWTVPDEAKENIRVVLIGGGQGGQAGANGETGEPGGPANFGAFQLNSPGEGGAGGEGGYGGKILSITIPITSISSFAYSCGEGGQGGTSGKQGNDVGADGDDTLFGDYSSVNGTIPPFGFYDYFSGVTASLKGGKGLSGGKGSTRFISTEAAKSERPTIEYNGVTYTAGIWGERDDIKDTDGQEKMVGGGGGGGAAVGADGNAGGRPSTMIISGSKKYYSGRGGDGASAAIPGADSTGYGEGGQGGHGGGGSGGSGAWFRGIQTSALHTGETGTGGLGSAGGKGGDGAIIVMW